MTHLRLLETSPARGSDRFGPRSSVVVAVLDRAARLTREEIEALDQTERRRAGVELAAWDHLRDRLGIEPERSWRFAARDASWQAVRRRARRLGLRIPRDDGYWRVVQSPGCGAARAARFAATALVAPERLEPEYLEVLLGPWRSIAQGLGHRRGPFEV